MTSVADEYPDVDFYYFYTPYSVVRWSEFYRDGTLLKRLEAERYITELILQHDNIHLYSFMNRFDITTDLNNYKDAPHYANWINSLILRKHQFAINLSLLQGKVTVVVNGGSVDNTGSADSEYVITDLMLY